MKYRRKIEDSIKSDKIEEFYCKTCKLARDPKIMQWVIDNTKPSNSLFVPKQIRKVEPMGVIFTKNSIVYKQHHTPDCQHDWGQYQPTIIPFI